MLFDNPIFKNWFTDLMDVCRVVPVKDGNVTRQERKKVAEKVPCRVYLSRFAQNVTELRAKRN